MKIEITNISFNEYIALPDKSEYDYYLKYGGLKPLDCFNIGLFMNLSFGFVKDMQEYFNYSGFEWKDFFNEISKLKGYSLKELAEKSIFDLHCTVLYLRSQVELINKLESEN
jgi:hypothetical protein